MMLVLSPIHKHVEVHIQTIILMSSKSLENFQVSHSYKAPEKDILKPYF